MYNDLNECIKKVNKYIKNNKWKEIAKAGYKLSKQHTYVKRVEKLLPTLQEQLKIKKNNSK